jgi:hypothetical protein
VLKSGPEGQGILDFVLSEAGQEGSSEGFRCGPRHADRPGDWRKRPDNPSSAREALYHQSRLGCGEPKFFDEGTGIVPRSKATGKAQ